MNHCGHTSGVDLSEVKEQISELQKKIDGLLDSIEASKVEDKLDEVLRVQKESKTPSSGHSVRNTDHPENGKTYRGFRLYQKPGYTSSSGTKFYWSAYRHIGAKLYTVYVGVDPKRFEAKIDAWLSKRPSLEKKVGE